eukprot:312704_1
MPLVNNMNCNYTTNHETIKSKELEQVCMEYHQQLVPEFISATKANISQRLAKMMIIINNNSWVCSKPVHFTMDIQAIVLEAMTSIAPVIQGNTLVDLKACKTVPQSKDAYRKVARNRLNRQKPKFIGNFVFAPLLFYRLYQFCRRMFAENGVIAFVSVLSDVLCPQSVIRFEQTRAQPLVPYNTLAMDNAFRSSCLMLLKHYDLEKDWSNANKKKSSAKDKWHHFITHSIPKLTQRCCWPQYKAPQCLFIPQNSTGKFTTTVPLIPPSDIPQCVQRPSKPDTPMHNTYRHPRNNEEQSGAYVTVCANNSTQNHVFGYAQNHINHVSCNNERNHNMSLQRQTTNRDVYIHRFCDGVEHAQNSAQNRNYNRNFNCCDFGNVDAIQSHDWKTESDKMDFEMHLFEFDPFEMNESASIFDHECI